MTDITFHFIIMFLLTMALRPKGLGSWMGMFSVPIVIEIAQFFTKDRFADVNDALHGMLGVLMAYCLIQLYHEIHPVYKKWREDREDT